MVISRWNSRRGGGVLAKAVLSAACAALVLLETAPQGEAQEPLGAPTINSVTARASDLTVVWTAPSGDGGAAIASYDLRYIEASADETVEANWTEVDAGAPDPLSYTLTGLRDSTAYRVQVRADNGTNGPWSDKSTSTTTDHGDTIATATAITLGTDVPGRIHPAGDTEHFTFTLDSDSYVLLEVALTASTLTLTPTLYDDQDAEVSLYYLNKSGGAAIDGALYALDRLEAGTYTVRIAAGAEETGSYLLKPRIETDLATTEETC